MPLTRQDKKQGKIKYLGDLEIIKQTILLLLFVLYLFFSAYETSQTAFKIRKYIRLIDFGELVSR